MPNRLAHETSPYLLQHADNPVDWWPWAEPALALAREADKPILLSIGYSSCHWCHVMAHESFEDAEVAALMNRHFVNIKVDREERPDLDQIYQLAYQMLAQRGGGWPLTMFLTPQQVPFFCGTYFPKQPRHQMPGFLDLLPRVAEFYLTHKAEIAAQNAHMFEGLQASAPAPLGSNALSLEPLADAARDLAAQFDPVWGGFGRAPKFPRPAELEFALRGGNPRLAEMALFTLDKMQAGGIYDQLGGGFCRYSVDERWAIPHFEKMLYDNGPLLALYADAYVLTGNARYREVCEQTVQWLTREMQSPEGGFYAALDADSEHEEGKFYVWDRDEVARLLSPEEYRVAAPHYGLDQAPNFEDQHWHCILAKPVADADAELLASARAKLFAAREQRVRPGRDDKQLTSWNALMIRGLAHAGRRLHRPDWLGLAQRATDFIRGHLWDGERLCASYKDGQAKFNAYLDDYAFLIDALLELLQGTFRTEDLAFAQALAERLLTQFEGTEQGGFFFTSHDHETLIHRPKPGADQATPSGNGVAALALQRLGHLLGEPRYGDAASRALRFFHADITRQAGAYPTLLLALAEHRDPPTLVVLRGTASDLESWRDALGREDLPHCLILALPAELAELPRSLAKPLGERMQAWICRGHQCLPPLGQLDDVLRECKRG